MSEVKAQLDEFFAKATAKQEQYRKLLPKTGDVSLVILKGNLIIEEMLFEIAASHCAVPEELAKTRLSFAQLLSLTKALVKMPVGPDVWEMIGLLNSLRNSLVHNLQPKEIDGKVLILFNMSQVGYPPMGADEIAAIDTSMKAAYSIAFIMGALSILAPVAAFVEKNLTLNP